MDTWGIISSGDLPEASLEDLYAALEQAYAPDVRHSITLICFAVYENIDSPVDAQYVSGIIEDIARLCGSKALATDWASSRAWRSIEKFIVSVAFRTLVDPVRNTVGHMCEVADKFVAFY